MMKIGIVIINWNGWRDTGNCLASLHTISVPKDWNISTVVVDNASTDESVSKLTKDIKKYSTNQHEMVLIESNKNRGFSGGNNLGMQYLLGKMCDYILLLNNDTLVEKHFLEYLVNRGSNSKYEIVGPKIYFAPGFEYQEGYSKEEKGKVIWYAGGNIDWNNVYCTHRGVDIVDVGQFNSNSTTDFVSGCCMLIKREVLEKVGLFDEKYFVYLEDVDFCIRARDAGFRIGFIPESIIWHKNAQSSGKPGSQTHVYYQTRNRMIFGMKYAKVRTKIALFRESFSLLLKGSLQRKAIVDFYLHHHGKK